jgi:hypothetical protein
VFPTEPPVAVLLRNLTPSPSIVFFSFPSIARRGVGTCSNIGAIKDSKKNTLSTNPDEEPMESNTVATSEVLPERVPKS